MLEKRKKMETVTDREVSLTTKSPEKKSKNCSQFSKEIRETNQDEGGSVVFDDMLRPSQRFPMSTSSTHHFLQRG